MHLALDRIWSGRNSRDMHYCSRACLHCSLKWIVELSTLKVALCCFQWVCVFNAKIVGPMHSELNFQPLSNIYFSWLTLNAEATTKTNGLTWVSLGRVRSLILGVFNDCRSNSEVAALFECVVDLVFKKKLKKFKCIF